MSFKVKSRKSPWDLKLFFIYITPTHNNSYLMTLFILSISRLDSSVYRDPTFPREQTFDESGEEKCGFFSFSIVDRAPVKHFWMCMPLTNLVPTQKDETLEKYLRNAALLRPNLKDTSAVYLPQQCTCQSFQGAVRPSSPICKKKTPKHSISWKHSKMILN